MCSVFIFASTNFFQSCAGGDPAAAKRQEHLNVTAAARLEKDNMASQQQVPISSKFASLFLQHNFESYYYILELELEYSRTGIRVSL